MQDFCPEKLEFKKRENHFIKRSYDGKIDIHFWKTYTIHDDIPNLPGHMLVNNGDLFFSIGWIVSFQISWN